MPLFCNAIKLAISSDNATNRSAIIPNEAIDKSCMLSIIYISKSLQIKQETITIVKALN